MDDGLKTKICTKCPEKGPQALAAFYKSTRSQDGHHSLCRECKKSYDRKYRKALEQQPPIIHVVPETKVCSKCPEQGEQPITAFYKKWRSHDGYKSICKRCCAAYHTSPDARTRQKAYRDTNRERRLARMRQWRKDNWDIYLAGILRWIDAHPKEHQALKRKAERRREARKKALPWDDIDEQAIYERDGGICQLCHERVSLTFHSPHPRSQSFDHVIPSSEGGPTTMQNIVLVHRGCNSRKGNRHNIQQQQRLFG